MENAKKMTVENAPQATIGVIRRGIKVFPSGDLV